MKLISEEIIEENGLKYKVETYDNGAIVKTAWSDEPIEPIETIEPVYEPSDTDNIMMAITDLYEVVNTANEINQSNNDALMLALTDLYENSL